MLLLSSCGIVRALIDPKASTVVDSALCEGLEQPIDRLNDALLVDGGPKSIVAGAQVIAGYDRGCE